MVNRCGGLVRCCRHRWRQRTPQLRLPLQPSRLQTRGRLIPNSYQNPNPRIRTHRTDARTCQLATSTQAQHGTAPHRMNRTGPATHRTARHHTAPHGTACTTPHGAPSAFVAGICRTKWSLQVNNQSLLRRRAHVAVPTLSCPCGCAYPSCPCGCAYPVMPMWLCQPVVPMWLCLPCHAHGGTNALSMPAQRCDAKAPRGG